MKIRRGILANQQDREKGDVLPILSRANKCTAFEGSQFSGNVLQVLGQLWIPTEFPILFGFLGVGFHHTLNCNEIYTNSTLSAATFPYYGVWKFPLMFILKITFHLFHYQHNFQPYSKFCHVLRLSTDKNQSHYRPEVPTGFQEFKIPRLHDNGSGCQPYAPATFIPRKYSW